jgi:hypothetical protein
MGCRCGLVLVAGVIAGCGGAEASSATGARAGPDGGKPQTNEAEPVVSGSRLRARWQVADQAQRLVGWHDDKLGLDCGFEGNVFPQRRHACLPSVAEVSSYFSDPSCTVPVSVAESDCATTKPLYAAEGGGDCASEPTFFAIGESLNGKVYTMEKDSCVAHGDGSSVDLHALGAAVPASTFVVATETHDDAGQMWLATDDGARIPWGGWDGTRAVQPTLAEDGTMRWAPWYVWQAGQNDYADPTCTVPAARPVLPGQCQPDAVLSSGMGVPPPPEQCGGPRASFLSIGARVDTSYAKIGTSCVAQPQSPGADVWLAGAAIPADTLLSSGDVRAGAGRVQVQYATLRGHPIRQTSPQLGSYGEPVPDTFVDVTSGLPCQPSAAADGKVRCMPVPEVEVAFADAQCTQPVVELPSCGAGAPSIVTLVKYSGSTCIATTIHGYAVVGSPTQVFGFDPDGCRALYVPGGLTPYALGPELPAEKFVEVTEKVD